MWCGIMWSVGQCWEKCHSQYKKRHMIELINNVSHVFINNINVSR